MEQAKGNPGINNLGKVLQGQISSNKSSDLLLDYGSIQSDYSLLTNTFPVPIPRSDYMALRDMTSVPGDRVLVGWIQNDAVVIGVIAPA